jgi:imidazole glycerol phosphate synthase glutamine amidotransferase subunit
MDRTVTIVRTGVSNTASVTAAFERCGLGVSLTTDRAAVEDAALLVLPGVGSFGAGMDVLERAGLSDTLRERVAAGRPTAAFCLGLQLLCATSEESPGERGLGVIDARVERFPGHVRVPQFGWNHVDPGPGCELLTPGHAYFANSYRIPEPPDGWSAATAEHGGPFVAALERGAVLACQFHPELSGVWGLDLLKRWLVRAAEEATTC